MPHGTIKKLVADKGFGFIETDGDDVFFHCSVVADSGFDQLQVGQHVEFSLGRGPKGPRAENVTVIQPVR